jgi:hypothetical protein
MTKTKKRGGIKRSSIGMTMIMMIMIEERKGDGTEKGTGMSPSIMGTAI